MTATADLAPQGDRLSLAFDEHGKHTNADADRHQNRWHDHRPRKQEHFKEGKGSRRHGCGFQNRRRRRGGLLRLINTRELDAAPKDGQSLETRHTQEAGELHADRQGACFQERLDLLSENIGVGGRAAPDSECDILRSSQLPCASSRNLRLLLQVFPLILDSRSRWG